MTERKRLCIVTGASRGIGAAICDGLRADGFDVVGLSRGRPEGWPGEYIEADLATPDGIANAQREVTRIGRVWGLVNNAGLAKGGAIADLALEDFERVFAANVYAPALLAQAAVPLMTDGGRIVNICSTSMNGKAERSIYGSSKAALASLTRTWAAELGGQQILCNALSPGPVDTALFRRRHTVGSELEAQVLARIPVGRIGSPENIADVVRLLISPTNEYLTGQVIAVDGGGSLGSG